MTKFETLLLQLLASARMTAAFAFHCLVCEDIAHRSELFQALRATDKRAFYFANRQAILEQLENANAYGAEWDIKKQSADTRLYCALYDALSTLKDKEEKPEKPATFHEQKP